MLSNGKNPVHLSCPTVSCIPGSTTNYPTTNDDEISRKGILEDPRLWDMVYSPMHDWTSVSTQ